MKGPSVCMIFAMAKTDDTRKSTHERSVANNASQFTWKYGLRIVFFTLYSYEHSRVLVSNVPTHDLLLMIVPEVEDRSV
jgi:hypothetical protein